MIVHLRLGRLQGLVGDPEQVFGVNETV